MNKSVTNQNASFSSKKQTTSSRIVGATYADKEVMSNKKDLNVIKEDKKNSISKPLQIPQDKYDP